MMKRQLWLLAYFTVFLAGLIAVGIVVAFGDTWWAVAPLIVWFICGQIWVVPQILKKPARSNHPGESGDPD